VGGRGGREGALYPEGATAPSCYEFLGFRVRPSVWVYGRAARGPTMAGRRRSPRGVSGAAAEQRRVKSSEMQYEKKK
jgi:hypothetical protein